MRPTLPILIEPLQVVDYGLHVEQLVNPDCRPLRVGDAEVLENEEQNLSTSLQFVRFLCAISVSATHSEHP